MSTGELLTTRRQFVAGGLAAAAAVRLSGGAQAASLALGAHDITVLSDGNLNLPVNFVLPEQSETEVAELLEPHGMATDVLTPDCNITLLRSGERLALFDVGAGPNFQSSAGRLGEKLEAEGVDPSDVTDVILTHAHPDHLWGILDDFDDPLYPEARIWVPEAEWDYWLAGDTLSKTPDARKSFVVGAQARFAAIEDRVFMVVAGQEVLPGVEAVDTSGHTPGHMSYLIHDGAESVLVLGDAVTNAVISFERPDWASGTDQDRDRGIETRKRLLDRLAADRSRIIGFHLPHPGQGRVERNGGSYRFIADQT